MANSANLPAPYGGVNDNVPTAALKSPQCKNLLNFNVTTDGIALRNGDSKYTLMSHLIGGVVAKRFAQYGNHKLFAIARNGAGIDIWDVDSATVSTTSVVGGSDDFARPYTFNKNLYLFAKGSLLAPGLVYNGSAWGSIGYTLSGDGFGGCPFKHRNYIILQGTASYAYSGIDAITGATTTIDLAGVISEQATLSAIAPITLSDNVATITLLAFVFSTGEIIFYSGSYPDSDNWAEAGRAQVGQPLDYMSGMAYQGDYLLFCDSGVVSLRNLFLKGSEDAASLTVNSNIQNTWQLLVKTIRSQFSKPSGPITDPSTGGISGQVTGVWDRKTARLIISFPLYQSSSTAVAYGSTYFVFSVLQQAWHFQRSFGTTNGIYDICFYKNKVLLLDYDTDMMAKVKEGATGFTDRNTNDSAEVGYTFEMLSAPIPSPKTSVTEFDQIEPIIETDLAAETKYNLVADFGRQTTNDQTAPNTETTVSKPAANVGIHGTTYVQVKMSGTTTTGKTVGLKLYSYNLWFDKGQQGSR